jgi:hypothetical protein
MNCNSLVPVQYFSNDPNPDMWWNNLTERMDVEQVQSPSVEAPAPPLLDSATLRLADRYMISELEIQDGTKASIFFLDYLEKNYQLFKNTFITFENNDQLLRHKNGRTVGLNAAQIMKITTQALTILKENQSTYIQLDAHSPQLLVSRQDADSLVIGHKIKELGKGDNGVVYLFDVVTMPILMAAKFSNPGGLKDEVAALRTLYGKTDKSSIEGIQDRIYAAFKLQECSSDKEVQGYITSYYDKGNSYSVFPSEEFRGVRALSVMRQLFEGIRHAHALNVIHKDIYPSNLLIKTFDGKFEISLADWGESEVYTSDDLKNIKRMKKYKAYDIKYLCEGLYNILTGVYLAANLQARFCTKTRQELLAFRAECKDTIRDFEIWKERMSNIFEPKRLQEIEIPDELIALFAKASSYASPEECPKPEAFIQVIDQVLSQRGSA